MTGSLPRRSRPPARDAEGGRNRRTDGERSYRAIVEAAARLATTRGLEGLSLGDLAAHVGMSKSGLYAHFGSKEQLQLAVVRAAAELMEEAVLSPARGAADPLTGLRVLCDRFLGYAQETFPGGCFFASAGAEQDTRPGEVRDRIRDQHRVWSETLAAFVSAAQDQGRIRATEEPEQVAFELNSLLHLGNDAYVMFQDRAQIERARTGIDRLLVRMAVTPGAA
ncbi:TetR/AcrR family transcriptional regulator [Streptomyces sp. J2-1]|uniref:TetR/AcrR family transcriptional regulator n=1 Tax=Streptomyces corallincola TaxID=2851888 RepID=UPI001C38BC30|nr:TetR/AcrR family transcriptional regulator [Streptomyces corallincola]MBV2353935.1 TetR/AcrR family transcriptional regulator [Streptomyces corallincola]